MKRLFTYYCYRHRSFVAQGPPPSEHIPNLVCGHCHERLYWVPDGGTVVPRARRRS